MTPNSELGVTSNMNATLRQVNVFIASPGDVSDARDCVRKAIERINRLVARPSGFLLEPIGWEDIPAGKAKRTQEIINPYVEGADIFIGILNKRFGSPTGVAESGTEEEYNVIEKRWNHETSRPEIMIYFKKLSKDDLTDPGEQLQRVLEFKRRICDTVLYKEFEASNDLGEQIENALAAWIYKHQESSTLVLREVNVDALETIDLVILTHLVQHLDINNHYLQTITNHPKSKIDSSIARLERDALVTRRHGKVRPTNSTEGFLSIVKHLINGEQWRLLLQSDYYSHMLRSILHDLIAARFHYKIGEEMADLLRMFALLSPAAASYILFGDTTLYDNLFEHTHTLGDQQIIMANEMMKQNILHQVLLRYAEDSINAKLLDTLEGKSLPAS